MKIFKILFSVFIFVSLFSFIHSEEMSNMIDMGIGSYLGDSMEKDIQEEVQKVIIAHRGASGYLPQHTLEAYTLAYGQGADYIEPDLNMTKDGVLVCVHNIDLEATTDVEEKFPEMKNIGSHYYVKDFTLKEIKTLSATIYRNKDGSYRYPGRFNPEFKFLKVPTFEEVIMLVKGLNNSTGRNVGIYPEMKNPSWHKQNGLNIEKTTLDILRKHGYLNSNDKVFIQSFYPDSLKTVKFEFKTELPPVQLIGSEDIFEPLLTEEGFDEIATYAVGIGPDKNLIVKNPSIVERAHKRNLLVHPWTFVKERVSDDYKSLGEELSTFYYTYNVDGLFVDQPDLAYWVLNKWRLK